MIACMCVFPSAHPRFISETTGWILTKFYIGGREGPASEVKGIKF
jgi:hypothetical protein